MKLLQNDIKLGFKDLDFEGVRLAWDNEDMPWKNKKEREAYLDNLVEEGTEYNSAVYKRVFKQMNKRDIHVKVSRSFIAKTASILLMGIAALLGIKLFLFPAMVILGISFALQIWNQYLVRRANELYVGLESGPELIDFLFANRETL